MTKLRTLDTLILEQGGLKGKTALVRADLNVPMEQGRVADNTRIARIVPTLERLIEEEAKIVILSHFGRPGGEYVRDLSLAPITDALSEVMGGKEVRFGVDCVGPFAESAVEKLKSGDIALLENLRFHPEEKKNDQEFVEALAAHGDVFINDAFACSHREHASILGLAEALPSAAGLLMQLELEQLENALENPERPLVAVVGGSKVSTKLGLLERLVANVDVLLVGGGIANTFLYAQGYEVGESLCEKDMKKTALKILDEAENRNCRVFLPNDAVVAKQLEDYAECEIVHVDGVPEDTMILDVGPRTIQEWERELEACKTVVWNGPLGAFEFTPFDVGTTSLSRIISELTRDEKVKSIAGGGDVLAALTRAGLRGTFTYISTAGGAFLEWLEGKELPGVKVLMG